MRLTAAETIKMWVDFHKINYVHKDCDLNFYQEGAYPFL